MLHQLCYLYCQEYKEQVARIQPTILIPCQKQNRQNLTHLTETLESFTKSAAQNFFECMLSICIQVRLIQKIFEKHKMDQAPLVTKIKKIINEEADINSNRKLGQALFMEFLQGQRPGHLRASTGPQELNKSSVHSYKYNITEIMTVTTSQHFMVDIL